ncbi:hypothetical protein INN71_01125 [Nocardioides sp. ChNu-153]|uniref:hypothetical protein n=1 Tax=unclassified Nocardioides TaxID=2615069 RepID=UPI002404DD61|nr:MULTISPECIES: hypothetical protein [unclassified Nocardioides]MDF9716019.1 hypothetical protein [Nocardioides sp. ChNu-99]MDN7119987.1 hypothetical protein [Nocardioides sp. ChNu-153]
MSADPADYLEAEGDSRTWHTGAGVVDSLMTSAASVGRDDWLQAGLAGLCAVDETANLLSDPFGRLLRAGIGWVMEHFQPLHELLDAVTGNPDEVLAFAGTWTNVGEGLLAVADQHRAAVAEVAEGWTGRAAGAYTVAAAGQSTAAEACAEAALGMAGATRLASSLVTGVRAAVRAAIADLVAWLAPRFPVLASGVGTGPILLRLAQRVRGEAQRLAEVLQRVVRSVETLCERLDACTRDLGSVVSHLGTAARVVVAPSGFLEKAASGAVRHTATYDDV